MASGIRIRRGVLRLGIIGAAAVFILGAGAALLDAHDDIERKVAMIEQGHCLKSIGTPTLSVRKIGGRDEFLFKENGCPGPLVAATEAEVRSLANIPRPIFASVMLRDAGRGVGISLVGALVILAMAWAIGWALSGFASDAT